MLEDSSEDDEDKDVEADAQLSELNDLIHQVAEGQAPSAADDGLEFDLFAGTEPDELPEGLPEISLEDEDDVLETLAVHVGKPTRKTTVSFKSEVYEELLDAHQLVRDLLPMGTEVGMVSKSAIVNAAVKLMVMELKLRKNDSLLLKQIARDAITP